VITNTSDWPELLFALEFDKLSIGASYTLPYYIYSYSGSKSTNSATLTPNSSFSLNYPYSFKRLNTYSTANQYYTSSDQTTGALSTGSDSLYSFDANNAFTCNTNFFLGKHSK